MAGVAADVLRARRGRLSLNSQRVRGVAPFDVARNRRAFPTARARRNGPRRPAKHATAKNNRASDAVLDCGARRGLLEPLRPHAVSVIDAASTRAR